MTHLAIDRHELARRQAQLSNLQRQLSEQEGAFHRLHAQIQRFIERYKKQLGVLYLELDGLESQLHTALVYLYEALQRHGVSARKPEPPKASALPPLLHQLPPGAPLPAQPEGGLMQELTPPSIKQLYRRAAMRLHPDRAADSAERQRREQDMMTVNRAYEAQDRAKLEALLLACGEAPERVTGDNSLTLLDWLQRAERAVQGRLRVVRAHHAALRTHAMHQLWQSVTKAEAEGLDPLGLMAQRLRTQITERRQELYIGQRLQPGSELAPNFLLRRAQRMAAA